MIEDGGRASGDDDHPRASIGYVRTFDYSVQAISDDHADGGGDGRGRKCRAPALLQLPEDGEQDVRRLDVGVEDTPGASGFSVEISKTAVRGPPTPQANRRRVIR